VANSPTNLLVLEISALCLVSVGCSVTCVPNVCGMTRKPRLNHVTTQSTVGRGLSASMPVLGRPSIRTRQARSQRRNFVSSPLQVFYGLV